jgi:hypothetical protein
MNHLPEPWDEKYLRAAIKDEIALAAVHTKFRCRITMPNLVVMETVLTPDPPRYGSLAARHARTTPAWPLPRWRRDWRAAGPLIGELRLAIRNDPDEGTVSVGNGSRRRNVTESYADHPGIDEAVIAAIVRAAIQILTEARES